ncbi:MAG: hypothetical protein AAF196_15805 [Planctomycetota bacterium]
MNHLIQKTSVTHVSGLPQRRGVLRLVSASALAVALSIFGSCAAHNFDFDEVDDSAGAARAGRLVEDLREDARRADDEAEDASLYDLYYFPLVHLDIHTFSATDESDAGLPDGFTETDIESYLPLFGFVDATIDRYDEEQKLYEHHEYGSYLWGLVQTHDEEVDTQRGLRTTSNLRILWLFDWESDPVYLSPELSPDD